ncbi:cystathionine gamma-synthase [Corynebacterium uterequi]|uniref:Cystathionine beta-lyase/cystathionine gamma-synthase n=1 Tax=Corynebacterium uterequi TaxID=1072256 RepID=A0A0G3HED2_9CORY|nr:cystathionine gamma-synthase [Corynebacterium uterequi]AKK11681.1 cystathionine beta-lyase/cystathionine gamma-synthase [Corynebacterium uterequi]
MSLNPNHGFSTHSIHAGYEPDPYLGPINVPIYASTTFAQNGPNELRGGYEYGRVANPTVASLERTVAALEGADFAVAFGSGMAATDTLLRILLEPGAHLVLGNDAYGGTWRLIDTVFGRWGVDYTVVDTTDADAVAAAVTTNTRLIWLETPTNPLLNVTDIAAVAAVKGDALLVVDNTFASPYLQTPLALGADVVVHSATKYLGGHSDVIGGLVVTSDAALDERLRFYQGGAGAILSPFDAYLTTRGIKTLGVRMDRHCDNAEALAHHLAEPSRGDVVAAVHYPGLASHPGHDVATRQMRRYGGMVSVSFHSEDDAKTFCTSTSLICLAESLGGVESLLEHPASMTHQSATGSQLEVPRELVRISVGIEDVGDLLADVEQALAAVARR